MPFRGVVEEDLPLVELRDVVAQFMLRATNGHTLSPSPPALYGRKEIEFIFFDARQFMRQSPFPLLILPRGISRLPVLAVRRKHV